jgi:hypothetical protein
MALDRSLEEIFALHWEACKYDLHKCIPATVTAVNAGAQTVDVQIAVNGLIFDELGTAISVPAFSITSVPLGTLRGGGFFLWLPVVTGDSVMLHFTDRSMDNWSAGDGSATDPGCVSQHSADSCYAVPMIAPSKKALTSPGAGALALGVDGSDEQIVISTSDVKIGRGASNYVALANLVATELSAIKTVLAAIVSGGIASLTTGTVTYASPAVAYSPGPVAATIAKAQ